MRQPPAFNPGRAFGRSGAIPRSGVEAAAALLRTEFERQRHRRERDRLVRRLESTERVLEEQDRRAIRLCARILSPEDGET